MMIIICIVIIIILRVNDPCLLFKYLLPVQQSYRRRSETLNDSGLCCLLESDAFRTATTSLDRVALG